MDFWHYMFNGRPWFTGAVWANMTQWLLVTLPTIVWGAWHIGKKHGEHMRAVHDHLNTQHQAHLRELRRLHRKVDRLSRGPKK